MERSERVGYMLGITGLVTLGAWCCGVVAIAYGADAGGVVLCGSLGAASLSLLCAVACDA